MNLAARFSMSGVFCALLLLLTSGCMDTLVSFDELMDLNSCSTDADCIQTGGRCDTTRGACVAEHSSFPETLVLYITDTDLGAPIEQRFTVEDNSSDTQFGILLNEPLLIRGLVFDQSAEPTPVESQLTFRRLSEFSGLNLDPIYVDAGSSLGNEDVLFNYQVRLSPGLYEVLIEPEDLESEDPSVQRYYPLWSTVEVNGDHDDQSFRFFYTDSTRTVSSIVKGPGGEPIGGARVYAFDQDTGRRLSSVAITQCLSQETCGRFTFAVPESVNEFKLHLSGDDASALLPNVEIQSTFSFALFDFEEGDYHISVEELPEVNFPEVENAVLYTTVVQGYTSDGALEPLSGAVVDFRSVVGSEYNQPGVDYELSATTDADGNIVAIEEGLRSHRGENGIGIKLRPGEYEITVIPSTDGVSATTRAQVVIEADEQQTFNPIYMDRRALMTGVVLTPDGREVPHAQVEISNGDGASFVTTSGELGEFSLYVDRQLSDVLCVPPEESLLPWSRMADVDAFEDSYLEIILGVGTPVSGEITLEETGEPIDSALVEGYIVQDVLDSPSQLVPIARIRTTATGSFTVLVPEELNP